MHCARATCEITRPRQRQNTCRAASCPLSFAAQLKFREVSEEEYSLIYQTLEAKARHLKTQKKRKLMLTECDEDDNKPKLP